MQTGNPINDDQPPYTLAVTHLCASVQDPLGERNARRFRQGLERDLRLTIEDHASAGVTAQCNAIAALLKKIEDDLRRPVTARVRLRGFLAGRPFDTTLDLLAA